uniref:Uncharacterized protein n=1 Tax=Cacopsylla melanoneura TaxID=428564 RepID=A0A8D9EJ84_9HEMI
MCNVLDISTIIISISSIIGGAFDMSTVINSSPSFKYSGFYCFTHKSQYFSFNCDRTDITVACLNQIRIIWKRSENVILLLRCRNYCDCTGTFSLSFTYFTRT